MYRPWKYIENTFLIVSKYSYRKAIKLSNYHDAVLKAMSETEPLLVPIYDRYHVLHVALIEAYNTWKSKGGSQEGQTLNLEQMLDAAYSQMPTWDIKIQSVGKTFMKGTPIYLSIFPNGRKPFNSGSLDERINAYDTFKINMAAYADLVDVMAEAAATYLDLDLARDAQLAAKGNLKTGSSLVETARVNAMTMQWRNLGFSMDAFWNNPKYIESMFDLQTLREGRQSVYTGTLNPSENEAVLIRTFVSDDELRIINDGTADIEFYLATTANGTNSTPLKVPANDERTILISEFGPLDLAKHRYLTVVNLSAESATHYEVEVM